MVQLKLPEIASNPMQIIDADNPPCEETREQAGLVKMPSNTQSIFDAYNQECEYKAQTYGDRLPVQFETLEESLRACFPDLSDALHQEKPMDANEIQKSGEQAKGASNFGQPNLVERKLLERVELFADYKEENADEVCGNENGAISDSKMIDGGACLEEEEAEEEAAKSEEILQNHNGRLTSVFASDIKNSPSKTDNTPTDGILHENQSRDDENGVGKNSFADGSDLYEKETVYGSGDEMTIDADEIDEGVGVETVASKSTPDSQSPILDYLMEGNENEENEENEDKISGDGEIHEQMDEENEKPIEHQNEIHHVTSSEESEDENENQGAESHEDGQQREYSEELSGCLEAENPENSMNANHEQDSQHNFHEEIQIGEDALSFESENSLNGNAKTGFGKTNLTDEDFVDLFGVKQEKQKEDKEKQKEEKNTAESRDCLPDETAILEKEVDKGIDEQHASESIEERESLSLIHPSNVNQR